MASSGGRGALGGGLLSSLADVAKRLLQDRDKDRLRGGISQRRAATEPTEDATVRVSSFRMVGLQAVQAQLADRWPALAERVHATARSVIERHLVRGDVFERHGEDGYLVLFAFLGPEEAEFKSRIIAREIAERLLGEGPAEAAGLEVATHCAAIPARALVDGDVMAILSKALQAEESPASAHPLAAPAVAAEPAAPQGVSHFYSPMWDTRQMTLLHFRAQAPRQCTPLADRTGEVKAYETDIALVRAVATDLQVLAAEARRLPVTVVIEHASLTASSRRASLIQALASIPVATRKILTVEIGVSPDGFWTYGCKSFLEMSRPLGVGLAARLHLDEPRTMPSPSGLKTLVTDLDGSARPEEDSLRLLDAFGAMARAQGHECVACGLSSRALVLGAIGAGFRYVAGPVVHPSVGGLATALRFEPIDLYADVVRSAGAG